MVSYYKDRKAGAYCWSLENLEYSIKIFQINQLQEKENSKVFSKKTAIIDCDKSLSYQELNDLSNKIAHYIINNFNFILLNIILFFKINLIYNSKDILPVLLFQHCCCCRI